MIKIVLYKDKNDFIEHFTSCLECLKANRKEIANLIMKKGDVSSSFKIEMIFEPNEVAKYKIICEKFVREEEIKNDKNSN